VDLVVEVLEEEILQVLEYHLALELVQQELVVKEMLVVMEIILHLYILVVEVEALAELVQMEHLVKVEMVEQEQIYLHT
jgi:hypothetical protein